MADYPVQDMQIGTRLDEQLAQEMVDLGFAVGIPTASGCIREAVRYWVKNKSKVQTKYERNKLERKHKIKETEYKDD